MVQELALFLLVILMMIFGLLMIVIAINNLIDYTVAKNMLYMVMNILPHLLGLLLFSYYYGAFIIIFWYFGLLSGKIGTQSASMFLPGNIVLQQKTINKFHSARNN